MKTKIWKVVFVLVFMAMLALIGSGWFLGATKEWPLAYTLFGAGSACCLIGIAIFPLAVHEDGETYFGILKKYLF